MDKTIILFEARILALNSKVKKLEELNSSLSKQIISLRSRLEHAVKSKFYYSTEFIKGQSSTRGTRFGK